MLPIVTLAALWGSEGDPIEGMLREAFPEWERSRAAQVEVWIDPAGPVLQANDHVRVFFRSTVDAYVTVFRVDTDGRVQVLFPATPWRQNWARAGRENQIKPGLHPYTFLVDDYPGLGYLFAVASPTPFAYGAVVHGEAWDYHQVGHGGRIEGDPYVALMDLIDAILPADSEYAYDVLPYDVGEEHEYPRFLCYDCHAYAAFPAWDPYLSVCTRVGIVVYNDPYYYPARAYGGSRVVLSRPRRLEPRFEFTPRAADRPYVVQLPKRPVRRRRSINR